MGIFKGLVHRYRAGGRVHRDTVPIIRCISCGVMDKHFVVTSCLHHNHHNHHNHNHNNHNKSWPLVSRLEPMAAITSPSAQSASSFGRWAPTPCRRGFACPYFRRRCCFFGHSPGEVAAESEVGRDHFLLCRDDAALAGLGSMERVVEQIVGAPVPQIWEPVVEGVQLAPQERVQNRIPDPIVDILVPQIVEAAVEVVRDTPLERVLHRTPEPVVDVPVPQITDQIGDFVQPVPL